MNTLLPTDYPPSSAGYVALVADENILPFLLQQEQELTTYLLSLSGEKWEYAYAPGKWTVKELLGHLCDAEIIFGYRALCLARNEKQNLPGFDENEYVREGRFNHLTPTQLLEIWQSARRLNLSLFTSLDKDAYDNTGTANGRHIKMKALPYMIAGHAQHHIHILKERYS